MTSAENSILELPNLKIFLEKIPPYPSTRLLLFGAHDNVPPPPPHYKKPSYGPGCAIAVKIIAVVNALIINTPLKDGHLHVVLVLAVFQLFYGNFALYKTDNGYLRSAVCRDKYLKIEMWVLDMIVCSCKIFNIL